MIDDLDSSGSNSSKGNSPCHLPSGASSSRMRNSGNENKNKGGTEILKSDSAKNRPLETQLKTDRNVSSNISITSSLSNTSTSKASASARLSTERKSMSREQQHPKPPPRASSQSITSSTARGKTTGSNTAAIKNPSSRVIINRQQSNILKTVKLQQQQQTSLGSFTDPHQKLSSTSLSSASSSVTANQSEMSPKKVEQVPRMSSSTLGRMLSSSSTTTTGLAKPESPRTTKIVPLSTRRNTSLHSSIKSSNRPTVVRKDPDLL